MLYSFNIHYYKFDIYIFYTIIISYINKLYYSNYLNVFKLLVLYMYILILILIFIYSSNQNMNL